MRKKPRVRLDSDSITDDLSPLACDKAIFLFTSASARNLLGNRIILDPAKE